MSIIMVITRLSIVLMGKKTINTSITASKSITVRDSCCFEHKSFLIQIQMVVSYRNCCTHDEQ